MEMGARSSQTIGARHANLHACPAVEFKFGDNWAVMLYAPAILTEVLPFIVVDPVFLEAIHLSKRLRRVTHAD